MKRGSLPFASTRIREVVSSTTRCFEHVGYHGKVALKHCFLEGNSRICGLSTTPYFGCRIARNTYAHY